MSVGTSYGTVNVTFLGVCFLLLFSADLTIQNLEKTLISSIHDDKDDFNVDGYHLLSLLYVSFGLSLWLGPSAVHLIGLRTSLAFASLLYTIFIAIFLLEEAWGLYIASVIGGIGAGILWTAEGKYLVLNSNPETVGRNIGIFFTIYNLSSFLGNIFAFYQMYGKTYIDRKTRVMIISSMTGLAALATVLFVFLRPVKNKTENDQKQSGNQTKTSLSELKKTWTVFTTKEILLLSLTFCFTGMQQAFNTGIYSPSVGFTLELGKTSKQLVPLSGMFCGLGQFTIALLQMLLGKRLSGLYWGRRIMILLAIASELISYALISINIPSSAVFGDTHEKAIMSSNAYLAMVCSFLLGIGDGGLNTQNFAILAYIFPNDSAQSCALYKFTKAIFVAFGFFLSSRMNLHYQLLVLTIGGLVGLVSFFYVDHISIVQRMKSCTQSEENNQKT